MAMHLAGVTTAVASSRALPSATSTRAMLRRLMMDDKFFSGEFHLRLRR